MTVAVRCVVANIELVRRPTPIDLVAEARRIFADDLADVGEVADRAALRATGASARLRDRPDHDERSTPMGMANLQRMAQQMQQEMLRIQDRARDDASSTGRPAAAS